MIQQRVDQSFAVIRSRIVQKRLCLFRVRQTANDVDVHTPEILLVAATGRRRDSQTLKLLPDQPVNEVVSRQLVICLLWHHPRKRDRRPKDSNLPHVASHDRRFTEDPLCRDQPVFVHPGDSGFIRLKLGVPRHIPTAAVTVVSDDLELSCPLERENLLLGFHGDLLQP